MFACLDFSSTAEQFGHTNTKLNQPEVVLILDILKALTKAGVKAADITVIAGYRGQAKLASREIMRSAATDPMLKAVNTSTSDSFQGQESKVIILSVCSTKVLGFMNDAHRLCAILSRAREGLIVINNFSSLVLRRPDLDFGKVAKYFKDHSSFKTISDQFQDLPGMDKDRKLRQILDPSDEAAGDYGTAEAEETAPNAQGNTADQATPGWEDEQAEGNAAQVTPGWEDEQAEGNAAQVTPDWEGEQAEGNAAQVTPDWGGEQAETDDGADIRPDVQW